MTAYFEDSFAVQSLALMPGGVRGCDGALQFPPRRFFVVRPPIMPLRLSEAGVQGRSLASYDSPPIGSIIGGRLALHA